MLPPYHCIILYNFFLCRLKINHMKELSHLRLLLAVTNINDHGQSLNYNEEVLKGIYFYFWSTDIKTTLSAWLLKACKLFLFPRFWECLYKFVNASIKISTDSANLPKATSGVMKGFLKTQEATSTGNRKPLG
jgi:hypothetical protein